jgi:uncharacterized protein (DUF488 family)
MVVGSEGVALARRVFSIGHSGHSLERLLDLLQLYDVRTIVDVRSYPTSLHVPHFALPQLGRALRRAGMTYVYLGRELGGRPRGRGYYDDAGRTTPSSATGSR